MQADLLFGGIAFPEFMEKPALELQGTQRDLFMLRQWQTAFNRANGLKSERGKNGGKNTTDCNGNYLNQLWENRTKWELPTICLMRLFVGFAFV